jgi:hypothetical protein
MASRCHGHQAPSKAVPNRPDSRCLIACAEQLANARRARPVSGDIACTCDIAGAAATGNARGADRRLQRWPVVLPGKSEGFVHWCGGDTAEPYAVQVVSVVGAGRAAVARVGR